MSNEKRAAELREKIAREKHDRRFSSGFNIFAPPPSKRAKAEEDTAVYNKLQNLREEEAEALEKRSQGMKKGGKVTAKRRGDGIAQRGLTKGRMI